MEIILLAVLAVLIFFMFRNGRKRQKDQLRLQERMQPGAEVMTNFGLFGTIVSIDEENNKVVLSTGIGSELTVHRQVIARVIEEEAPVAADDADAIAAVPVEDTPAEAKKPKDD